MASATEALALFMPRLLAREQLVDFFHHRVDRAKMRNQFRDHAAHPHRFTHQIRQREGPRRDDESAEQIPTNGGDVVERDHRPQMRSDLQSRGA